MEDSPLPSLPDPALPPAPDPAVPPVPDPAPPPIYRQRSSLRPALLIVLGVVMGWLLGLGRARVTAPPAGLPLAGSIAAAERQVAPSVVKIEVETPARFRHNLFHLPPGLSAPPRRRNEHSLGSGLIVDPRGYIVTNRHVVHRAQRIEVTLPGDSHVYFGRLLGEDRETDLAVVKIDAPRPLPAAHWGDSDRLGVGDWVVAIGSPFDLEGTVTAGIVSALHRPAMDSSEQFQSFIQTDAPINPGNSGGPLVDLQGDVIGINTAIYTDTDGYQGVGFALPSDLVRRLYPQLVSPGYVTRGSIGIYFEAQVDPAVRRVYHLESGVPLSQVAAHGPAAAAGLEAGDVIVSVDGASVASGDALMNDIAFSPVGRKVAVGYVRGGQLRHATLVVADRARLFPDQASEQPPPQPQPAPPAPDLGMELKDTSSGPEVHGVIADTFADRAGVQQDDVVIEINHNPVHSRADVDRLAATVRGGEDIALVVRRPNGDGTVSRWLLGGTLPPQLRPAGVQGRRP